MKSSYGLWYSLCAIAVMIGIFLKLQKEQHTFPDPNTIFYSDPVISNRRFNTGNILIINGLAAAVFIYIYKNEL